MDWLSFAVVLPVVYYIGGLILFNLAVHVTYIVQNRKLLTGSEEITALIASLQAPLYPRAALKELLPSICSGSAS